MINKEENYNEWIQSWRAFYHMNRGGHTTIEKLTGEK